MSVPVDSPTIDTAIPRASTFRWLSAVDRAISWAGDRTNPILVKETRQALKSRQFTITFGLLLLFGWLWSILGMAMIGPEIRYGAHGATMFFGYYFILSFPLLVIVPFSAFRSLATEQEDRTYELMSITTLGPRQIVRGKLGSAMLQMLIYLSAISPCLAFTYMLRGIDFPTILFVLFYATMGSLGLATLGLLVGTLTSHKHWQVVLSVLLTAGLLFLFIVNLMQVGVLMSAGFLAFADPQFWQGAAAFSSVYLSYVVLFFYAAAAAITFSSDNRSTRLRVTMLVQHVLFTGWMAWAWISLSEGETTVLIFYMVFIGLHWWAMGALMTGESPVLSPRVKRRLPQSFLGRVFLTWFNPGPGTGYLLVVSSLVGVMATVLIAVTAAAAFRPSALPEFDPAKIEQVLAFGVVGLSYVTFYLGLGLLLMRLLRKVTQAGVPLGLLVQLLLVLTGILVPLIVQMSSPTLRNSSYTLLQITNPMWTLAYMGDSRMLPPEGPVLLIVVPAAAMIVFLLNLSGVAKEVRQVRVAKPKRVAKEDAELAAIKHPPKPVKTSPWD